MTTLPGTPLALPVPPMLEQAVGYAGDARYVALYWSPAGDEAMYDDGQTGGDGKWTGYLAFVDHPAVALRLSGWRYKLGSSDTQATHWLVLDRETRAISVCEAVEARHFLRRQWPAIESDPLSPEDLSTLLQRLNETLAQLPKIPEAEIMAEVERLMAERDALVKIMTNWLDAQLPPNWQQNLLDAMNADWDIFKENNS